MVWTVNDAEHMMEVIGFQAGRLCYQTDHTWRQCIRWNVDAVITDVPLAYLQLRSSVDCECIFLHFFCIELSALHTADYAKADSEMSRLFLWTSARYWSPVQFYFWRWQRSFLEKLGGPFEEITEVPQTTATVAPVTA